MTTERRNQTALGRKRRREFTRSVQKLRDLGMPEWAVEYYRRAARVAGLPPHMVVCHVAVVAAGRQMQASAARESLHAGDPAADGARSPSERVPSYQTVSMLRQRVSSLLRDIQRQGTLLDAASDDQDEASEARSNLAVLRAALAAPEEAAPPPSKRRGKSPAEGH